MLLLTNNRYPVQGTCQSPQSGKVQVVVLVMFSKEKV
jgi:hypothetical protein